MKTRRNVLLIVIVLIIGGSIEILGIVGFRKVSGQSDIDEAASRLNADLKAAKTAGAPLESSDLAITPTVKDQENAALVIQQIQARFKNDVDVAADNGIESDISRAMLRGDEAQVRADLAKAKPILDLAMSAASKSGFDMHHDWDSGPYMTEPEYSTIKACTRFLRDRAEIEAMDGDHEKAAQDIMAGENLSNLMAKDQTLIGMLVRIAIDLNIMAGLNTCMSQANDPQQLACYEKAACGQFVRPDFTGILKGECYMGIPVFRNEMSLASLQGLSVGDQSVVKPDSANWKTSGLPKSKLYRAFLARHLEMWTEIMNLASKDQSHPDVLFKKMGDIADRYGNDSRPSSLFEKVLSPMYQQVGNASIKPVALRNVGLAMYKVLSYRMAHGTLPKTLADAGVTVADPFTGKPLGYIKTQKDFRIYSVNFDRIDNRGNPHPDKDHHFDLAMINPPPDPLVSKASRKAPAKSTP